jgi:putative endonuclease
MPFTYILRCSDGAHYVGSTWDVEARVWQHNSPHLGAGYTRDRQPVELVWSCWTDSIEGAARLERALQGWSRAKREALIRGDVEQLPAGADLAGRADVAGRACRDHDDGG